MLSLAGVQYLLSLRYLYVFWDYGLWLHLKKHAHLKMMVIPLGGLTYLHDMEDCSLRAFMLAIHSHLQQEHPDFLESYEGLAIVLSREGLFDEAIEVMKKLLEQDPQSMMAHTNLSVFYMHKGMKEVAEEWKAKATVLGFSQFKKK